MDKLNYMPNKLMEENFNIEKFVKIFCSDPNSHPETLVQIYSFSMSFNDV